MTGLASFTRKERNPDVLSCIANLSSDEVFTSPKLANEILNRVELAWSDANDGEVIWKNQNATFLDPCTKSGVFLREITKRLIEGLETKIPDLTERVEHILKNQVFGLGITRITSLISRRSLYCSKSANGKHSIASFGDEDGNIWFKRLEHDWHNGKCKFCKAGESEYNRGADLESHAYAFIHSKDINKDLRKWIGRDMQFDVVIGNPPYQLGSDGGTRDMPIYQHFVNQAKAINPKFIIMIIPSRWMAGGLGLKDFRKQMLSDTSIKEIVDYPSAKEVFPGVEIKGGVCYFLRDSAHSGDCKVTTIRGEGTVGPVKRNLGEHDIFVRDSRSIPILQKVISKGKNFMNEIVSSRTAFGLRSNYKGFSKTEKSGFVKYYAASPKGRITAWVDPKEATTNHESIDTWKAMVPKAGSGGGQKIPDVVLGTPWIGEAPSICTQSFLFVNLDSKEQAESVLTYYRTKFLRFLVSRRKITQDTTKDSYMWVPVQKWDRVWTDEELYSIYDLTKDEIEFIESQIKPMNFEVGIDES